MLSLALLIAPALVAQAPDLENRRVERLVELGKLWGKIRTFDPDLATKPIDWDRALVAALRSINGATTREAYIDAARTMLAALEDPATGLAATRRPTQVALPKEQKPFTWMPGETLLLHLGDVIRFMNTDKEGSDYIASLRRELGKARQVIFDLRPDVSVNGVANEDRLDAVFLSIVSEALIPDLLDRQLVLPATRVRAHFGNRGDIEIPPYTNGEFLQAGKWIQPSGEGSSKPLAFLVNDQSFLPVEAMALHQAGLALLVTEGDIHRNWAVTTTPFTLPEGLTGQWKGADSVFEDGSMGCFPDCVAPPSAKTGPEEPAIRIILDQWVMPLAQGKPAAKPPSLVPSFRSDSAYRESDFPSRELRTLAAIKFWSTIDLFFPHKRLMDTPWSEALGGFISAMDRAKDAQEYQLAVAAMVARLQDSHGSVEVAGGSADAPELPDGLNRFFGPGGMPIALAMIEGRPIVTRTWGEVPTRAGFRPGDEILSVDGESAKARMDRFRPYISASTPQRSGWILANKLLGGPLGKSGAVVVRHVDGMVDPLKVIWSTEKAVLKGQWRTGPEYQELPGNIGYVDLDRLSTAQVTPMFEALGKTRAVVLDMRGYPSGGAFYAQALFLKHFDSVGFRDETPLILGEPEDGAPRSATARKPIMFAKPGHYQGKVIMLMDERSQSAAEHMGLLLEAGAEATFIGSPTSGANGSVTPVVLPGALRVYFSGQNYLHADGRQLQRVGLQPRVAVRPTPQGLVDGRDEVLERAIRFIQEGQ
jgi:C-terminal processing protease CtpA/Prc